MNNVTRPPAPLRRRYYWLLLVSLLVNTDSMGQTANVLTIEACYDLARENYPLIKQMALLEKSREYSLDNASKGNLPQFSMGGQATLQSAVTSVPISFPDRTIPSPNKDQYRIFGEVNQSLTDGKVIRQQKELLEATTVAEKQKLEVELYKLHERINQLFFGILLLDAQQQQVTLMKQDIQVGLTKVEASIANGVALKSNADILRAELLRADQRTIELKANRQGFAAMLSLLIGKPVDESTGLQTPAPQVVSSEISRPELSLFDLQKRSFEIQKSMTSAKRNPRLSLFLQGGYGNPALNALSNTFDFYYLGGLRFNWNLSGFYTEDNDRQLLAINQSAVDVQREVFMFNTRVAMQQQNSEVDKYRSLIDSDQQIIEIRQEIKTTASAQLEYGTLTANDYLTYINAEDAARQNLSLHQIQLLMALYSYKTTTGN